LTRLILGGWRTGLAAIRSGGLVGKIVHILVQH